MKLNFCQNPFPAILRLKKNQKKILLPLYFPLTYSENSWFFLNIVRHLFAKVLGWEISCLTAWRVSKSLGLPKKCKNVKIWPNNMTLSTDNDLKSKNFRGKKVYILARNINSKRKFEMKAKQILAWKRPIFWVTIIQAIVSKTLRIFYRIFFCLQNISTVKKSAYYRVEFREQEKHNY